MKSINEFTDRVFSYQDENYNSLRTKMRDLYYYNMLHELTPDIAKSIKGRKIEILSFGYAHQDTYDIFYVGDIVEVECGRSILLDVDGFSHFINYYKGYNTFCIGDAGRTVYYRDVENDPHLFEVYNLDNYIGGFETLLDVETFVNSITYEKSINILNTATAIRISFKNNMKLWDFHNKAKK